MKAMANTPSSDSHEERKRVMARQAFFGLARWKVDDTRPNTIRLNAIRPPITSCSRLKPPPSLKTSAMHSSEIRPKPAPDATVKKMTENAGCILISYLISNPHWGEKAGCMDNFLAQISVLSGAPACWRTA